MAIMKMRFLLLAGSLIWLTSCASSEPFASRPVRADDPKGLKLPRGVPRGVDPDGTVVSLVPVSRTHAQGGLRPDRVCDSSSNTNVH
jgi:hypothetical protein